jgi:hypothetical protein
MTVIETRDGSFSLKLMVVLLHTLQKGVYFGAVIFSIKTLNISTLPMY